MFSFAATMLVGTTMSSGAVFASPTSSSETDFNSTVHRTAFIQMCLNLKRITSEMKTPIPRNYTFVLDLCDRSSKEWFGRFYFELWQRSWEKRTFDKVLKYVNPTLLFVTLVTILKCQVVLYRLDKQYKQAIWKVLMWYNTLTLAEYIIFYLPTFAAKNLGSYNLEHSIYGCKMLSFTRNIVANAPSWLLILFLVDQLTSMAARRRTTLTPFSVRCIMLGLIGALVVFNVHMLWLATYYPAGVAGRGTEARCILNNDPVQSVVFNRIYPLLLAVLHDILPVAMITMSLCVFLVLLCLKRRCNPDIATASLLGISYVLFATPESIEWLVRRVVVEKENKSLDDFKRKYTINVLAHTWSFFRYFFFVPILLVCNPEYRRMTGRLMMCACCCNSQSNNAEEGDGVDEEAPAASNDQAVACSSGTCRNNEASSPMALLQKGDSYDSLNLACGCVHRARCSSSVMCVCECLPVYRHPQRIHGDKPSSSSLDKEKEPAKKEKISEQSGKSSCWPQGKLRSRYMDRVAFPFVCHCEWFRTIMHRHQRQKLACSAPSSSDEENPKEVPLLNNGTVVVPAIEIEDREAMADSNTLNNYVIVVSQYGPGEENGDARVTSV